MPPKFGTFEEAFDDLHEKSVEEFLREHAKSLGIPWSEYCYDAGILGAAQHRRIRRHEVASYQEMLDTQEHEVEKEDNSA